MSIKTSKAVLAVAAISLTGALATTQASAHGKAQTTISIEAQSGGFFGYVHSSNGDCEAGRKVTLFTKSGQKVGSDVAQPNGPDSMWSISTGGQGGKFYAKVGKTSSCGGATSQVAKAQG